MNSDQSMVKIVFAKAVEIVGSDCGYVKELCPLKYFSGFPVKTSMKRLFLMMTALGISCGCSFAQCDWNLASEKPTFKCNYKLKNIFYDLGKWDLRPESNVTLDSVKNFMTKHDSVIVEIGSHQDSRASDAYCLSLSQKRAQSVVEYLIEKGINPQRLVAKGYGETNLIVSDEEIGKLKTQEAKEEAHQTNRRTEMKVLAVDYKKR